MNPEAFHIGPLTIRWYGIFVALGFLAGFLLASYRARRRGIPVEAMSDLLFWTMLSGILGARALYVAQNWSEFAANPAEIIRIDHGGLVFYGGFAAALLAVVALCRIRKFPLFVVGDILAPVVPLGQAFGRIGCLLNGCCFGRVYDGCCALHYPAASGVGHVQSMQGLAVQAGQGALPVFPIQALYSIMNLLTVAVLLAAERRCGLRGRLFGLFMALYGGARFFLEFGRGDYLGRVGGLTPAQIVCLVVVPVGVCLMWAGGRYGGETRELAP